MNNEQKGVLLEAVAGGAMMAVYCVAQLFRARPLNVTWAVLSIFALCASVALMWDWTPRRISEGSGPMAFLILTIVALIAVINATTTLPGESFYRTMSGLQFAAFLGNAFALLMHYFYDEPDELPEEMIEEARRTANGPAPIPHFEMQQVEPPARLDSNDELRKAFEPDREL